MEAVTFQGTQHAGAAAGCLAAAKHQGRLVLDGLRSLSDTVAEALAKHKGELDLEGLAAERIHRKEANGDQETGSVIAAHFGLLGGLVLLPLLLSDGKSSLRSALIGSGSWTVLLVVFFELIFPAL